MVWVWVNNPLTVVPMYYVFYVTGLSLTGRRGAVVDYRSFTITGLSFTDVGVAILVGCVPYAVIGSALSYQWALRVVRRRQARLARRRAAQNDYGTFRT
jgi:uncharacterized protein